MKLGAVADNGTTLSLDRLYKMRAEVVATRWTGGTQHRREHYDQLEATLDHPLYVVQVGEERVFTAEEWVGWFRACLREIPAAVLAEGRAWFRVGNEPNNPAFGNWPGDRYGHVLRDVRAATTGFVIVAAGPSMGVDGWDAWTFAMLAGAGGVLPADYFGVNCYAHLVSPAMDFFPQFGRLVVAEFSTLAATGTARASWTLGTAAPRLEEAGVVAACQFIVGGKSYGGWDEAYIMTDAEASAIGARAAEAVEVAPVVPTVNPHVGKRVIAWEVDADAGGWGDLADFCEAHGCQPDVKAGDGDSAWDVGEGIAYLRSRGLDPSVWWYVRADNGEPSINRGGGHPENEAAAIVGKLAELELQRVTLDAEAEVEGHADLFAILLDKLDAAGLTLDFFTWGRRRGHETYPWDLIKHYGKVLRPMLYDEDWSLAEFLTDVGGFTGTIAPAWGSNANPWVPTAAEVADMLYADSQGLKGESYWRYGSIAPGGDRIGSSELVKLRRF